MYELASPRRLYQAGKYAVAVLRSRIQGASWQVQAVTLGRQTSVVQAELWNGWPRWRQRRQVLPSVLRLFRTKREKAASRCRPFCQGLGGLRASVCPFPSRTGQRSVRAWLLIVCPMKRSTFNNIVRNRNLYPESFGIKVRGHIKKKKIVTNVLMLTLIPRECTRIRNRDINIHFFSEQTSQVLWPFIFA